MKGENALKIEKLTNVGESSMSLDALPALSIAEIKNSIMNDEQFLCG